MATENKAYYETLENVTFAYAKLAESDFKYGSKVDKEYSIDCVVSKADAKAFKKKFPKQSVKEFDNSEFEEKFKIAAPFPDQDEQYVLKLKKPHIKDGKEQDVRFRPKAFIYAEDGKSLVDITVSKLASNGSKGKVRYRVTTNDFGTFSQLDSVLFEHFVEYKKEGASPFGVPVGKVEEENQVATQARASAAKKQEKTEEGSAEDDSIPF